MKTMTQQMMTEIGNAEARIDSGKCAADQLDAAERLMVDAWGEMTSTQSREAFARITRLRAESAALYATYARIDNGGV